MLNSDFSTSYQIILSSLTFRWDLENSGDTNTCGFINQVITDSFLPLLCECSCCLLCKQIRIFSTCSEIVTCGTCCLTVGAAVCLCCEWLSAGVLEWGRSHQLSTVIKNTSDTLLSRLLPHRLTVSVQFSPRVFCCLYILTCCWKTLPDLLTRCSWVH